MAFEIRDRQDDLLWVDHIFARSILDGIKDVNPATGRRDLKRFKKEAQNQIANCMLLTKSDNGAAGKGAKSPEEWFADKSDKYLEMHLIPKDRELWKIENYEKFIAARKKLLVEKFARFIESGED